MLPQLAISPAATNKQSFYLDISEGKGNATCRLQIMTLENLGDFNPWPTLAVSSVYTFENFYEDEMLTFFFLNCFGILIIFVF
jgi:hypothetical protein